MTQTEREVWLAGDYGVIGRQTMLMSELLCEAVELRAAEHVLDVACGAGNTAIAAARRLASVVGIDFAPNLLRRARARASTEGLALDLLVADARALPFRDATFNVVLSSLGVMFASDHSATAHELLRTCRFGGRIGLASWTPGGFHGQLTRLLDKHAPPQHSKSPSHREPAVIWGTEQWITERFAGKVQSIAMSRREIRLRYRSMDDWFTQHDRYFGPLMALREDLEPSANAALDEALTALIERFNTTRGPDLVLPSQYLEVVMTR
jgi:ubiquinone/menaquinone biosynthesis C-methylase UbiE